MQMYTRAMRYILRQINTLRHLTDTNARQLPFYSSQTVNHSVRQIYPYTHIYRLAHTRHDHTWQDCMELTTELIVSRLACRCAIHFVIRHTFGLVTGI